MTTHIQKGLFSLILSVMMLLPVQAQINRTVDTKVADLLVQMPANTPAYRDKLMNDMLELGEGVREKICQQIVEPGSGDDTKARFAVESYSKYVSAAGKEEARKNWEKTIIKAFEQKSNKQVKAFFIRQLEFVGSDACLPVLKKCLIDDVLQSPAVKTMLLTNPSRSVASFAGALPKVDPGMQVELVKGIGVAGDAQYCSQLAGLYSGATPVLKAVILEALSLLPSDASLELLSSEAKRVAYNPDETNAVFALLDYCETIAGNQPDLAIKIASRVSKKSATDVVQINAMLLKSRIARSPENNNVLVDASKNKDKAYRGAAIEEAIREQVPVGPWIKVLNKAKSPELKTEVLYLLSQLKAEGVAPAIKPFLNDKDARVRGEAAVALAVVEGAASLNNILKYLSAYPGGTDTQAAEEALMLCLDETNIEYTVGAFSNSPVYAQGALMKVWGAKNYKGAFEQVYQLANSGKGELRQVALQNLQNISGSEHLDQLLLLFNNIKDNKETGEVAKAIVSAVTTAGDRKNAAMKVSQAAAKGDVKRYIAVFSAIGGKDAVKEVYKQYQKYGSAAALEALAGWGDHNALDALYDIVSRTGKSDKDKAAAFKGYISMVSKSSLPTDQKLLLLRKVMHSASDVEGKRLVVNAAGKVKTFLSFVYVSGYLNDQNLKNDAANALSQIALPDAGKKNGLAGEIVAEGLNKAKELITGPDSEYLKIDIENYLANMSAEKGYVSMFNGRDLSGWQGFVANPIKKKQFPAYKLRRLQKEADEKVKENWSVKDGMIVFNGKGNNLCSTKDYGDFEMIVDWRITKKGDSGIYLRGTPQVQVWDTSRVEVGAQVGSGGLYNNQKHMSKPLLVADNPIGEWNTFYIKMIGERVTVYLNGLLVVDNVVMENYWDRSLPIFPEGPIELQAHGTDLAFRDVYVRELNSTEFNLTEEEKNNNFTALFNGVDLTGWVGNKTDYLVENGEIVVQPKNGGHGNLFTEKEYTDFNYRFEFKLTPGANNGLGIRAPLEGDAAYVGMELQILDNTAPVYANLKPYQYHGSVYGVITAKRGFLKPVGEWNSEEVIVKGTHVKVILNGYVIVDGDIAKASENGTLDGKNHPGLKRTKGHIGFLGHGSKVYFRNIRIKEL